MSTRSITHIHEMDSLRDEIICSFFRHCDGYPSGHGDDLAKWLADKRLVNGIGQDFERGRDFNRAGTMAVPLMAHIQAVSGCEVIPSGSDGDSQYVYDVYFRDGEFIITVDGNYETTAKDFNGDSIEKQMEETYE